MKRTFYIGLATVLMFACGKSDSTTTTAGASAESTPGTLPANNPNAASAPQDQVVVLTGCLQGGERAGSGTVGTSGTRAGSGVTAGDANANAGADRFVLVDATATPPAAGSQAPSSSAGSSASAGTGVGGSGTSSYALVGNASDLRPQLNHQVRVTGRLNSSMTAYDGADRTTGSAGSPAGTSGVSGQAPATSPTSGAGMRTVTVDAVEVVASSCSQR